MCRQFRINTPIVLWGLAFSVLSVASNEFLSPPTTVKARENNTVLLPCYLNTVSNGKFDEQKRLKDVASLFMFFVVSDGAYAISVKWFKNDELLGDSANESIVLPSRHTLWQNGSLEILHVQPEDTGHYICEISRPDPWGVVRQKHAIEVLRKKRC